MKKWQRALLVVFAVVSVYPAYGSDIVKDGKPNAAVIIAANANQLIRTAADDFVYHVKLITGAELPVVTEDQELKQGNRVYLGESNCTKEFGIDVTKLPREGFRILSKGNVLAIVGKDEPIIKYGKSGNIVRVADDPLSATTQPASWFGVCHYFEKYHDVRWLHPGEEGIYCRKSPTLSVAPVDEVKAPPAIMRVMRCVWKRPSRFPEEFRRILGEMGYEQPEQWSHEYRLWERRMRLGVGGKIKCSHIGSWIHDQHYDEHREYFAQQVDGTRNWPECWPKRNIKLCVSNPDVARILIERGQRFFEADAKNDNYTCYTYNIAHNDSGGFCLCEKCQALDPPNAPSHSYGYTMKRDGVWLSRTVQHVALTDRYVTLWNKVAQGLAAQYPDRFVGVMRYSATGCPPVREKVHPNVILSCCAGNQLRDSNGIDSLRAEMQKWFDMGLKHFYWRPNVFNCSNCYGLPIFYADDLAAMMKYVCENGCMGFDICDCQTHFAAEGVNVYTVLRLMWEPSLETEELVRDYFAKAYGKASEAVYEYFMCTKAIRAKMRVGREDDPERRQAVIGGLHRYYDEQSFAKMKRLAERAEAISRTDDEQFRRRMQGFLAGVRYAELQLRALRLLHRDNETVEDYSRLIQAVRERERFLEELGPTWALSTPVLRAQMFQATGVFPRKLAPHVGWQYYGTCLDRRVCAVLPQEWRFYIDQSEQGEQKGIHTEEFDDSRLRTLSINDVWENQGFDYNGVAWYRTRFTPPKREPDKRHYLWFGAIDGSAWLYVNGTKVGERDSSKVSNAWYMPYAVDVTDHLRPGADNLIVVKVHDKAGLGGIYRGALLLEGAR